MVEVIALIPLIIATMSYIALIVCRFLTVDTFQNGALFTIASCVLAATCKYVLAGL
jgi:hypothetical protein